MGCSHVALAFGWLLFAFVVQRASIQVGEGLLYDPYKILGIAAVGAIPGGGRGVTLTLVRLAGSD